MLNRYEPLLTLINHCKPFLTTCFNRFFLISLWLLTGLTHFDSSNRGTYLVDMHMWWVLDLKNEIAYSTTKWNVSFLLDGGIWIPYPHIFKWFPTQRMCFVYELYIYMYIYMRVPRLAMIQLSKAFHIPMVSPDSTARAAECIFGAAAKNMR